MVEESSRYRVLLYGAFLSFPSWSVSSFLFVGFCFGRTKACRVGPFSFFAARWKTRRLFVPLWPRALHLSCLPIVSLQSTPSLLSSEQKGAVETMSARAIAATNFIAVADLAYAPHFRLLFLSVILLLKIGATRSDVTALNVKNRDLGRCILASV